MEMGDIDYDVEGQPSFGVTLPEDKIQELKDLFEDFKSRKEELKEFEEELKKHKKDITPGQIGES